MKPIATEPVVSEPTRPQARRLHRSARRRPPASSSPPRDRGLRDLGVAALACLALGGLSLLLPSTPSYDPWAWIAWGRDVYELDLNTRTGPSWKPLPVIFTTLFAPFGDAAPWLWLAVARAGGLLALYAAFRLARRLARRLAGGPAGAAAGVVAALALASSHDFVENFALGYSEGLLVAFMLAAVDRHLAGRSDQALVLGFAAALLRPETWPFLGAYGLYLLVRQPERRRLALGLAAAIPALWFLPELWGSGDPLRASSRAQEAVGSAPALAEEPARELLRRARWVLIAPFEVGILLAVGFAGLAFARARREAPVLVVGVMAVAWLGLVALMTERGYAGNERYLFAPVALGCVLAGYGWARAGAALTRLAGRAVPTAAPRLPAAVPAVVTALLFLAAVAVALPATRARGDELERDFRSLEYQAELTRHVDDAIDGAGGARRVLACGRVVTGDYQVPMLAWHLGIPAERIGLGGDPAGTVFRTRATPDSRPAPPPPAAPGFRRVAGSGRWTVLARCQPPSGGALR